MIMVPVGLAHSDILSLLHKDSFDEAWSAQSFRDLVAMPACFGYLACERDDPTGFILCQGDEVEAEIIVIATDPKRRRNGIASGLLESACNRTKRMFLEVAQDNEAAHAFYLRHRFEQIAVRKDYYKRVGGHIVDALVMQKIIR